MRYLSSKSTAKHCVISAIILLNSLSVYLQENVQGIDKPFDEYRHKHDIAVRFGQL